MIPRAYSFWKVYRKNILQEIRILWIQNKIFPEKETNAYNLSRFPDKKTELPEKAINRLLKITLYKNIIT